MSFSCSVKEELSRISPSVCCQRAELSSLVRMAGTIKIIGGQKKVFLQIQTVHAPTARRTYKLLKENFKSPVQIAVKRNNFLKDRSLYIILLDIKDCITLLKELSILPTGTFKLQEAIINRDLIKKRCCKRAFLRGAFLGSGSISDPKGPYHMEFVTPDKNMAEVLTIIIKGFDLKSKVVKRKNNYMIYLKDGDNIADMLGIIGAHNNLLKYEDIRVLKNMRNSVNRMVNCETANLNKTINASIRQINSINRLKESTTYDDLPDNLKHIAELRLEYPDLSLKELGQMLDPVLGKSGVSYRLKKIENIAQKLQAKKGDI